MAEIDVTAIDGKTYRVEVREGDSTSTHLVTVSADDLARLPEGVSADELVEASFRFLLDRESKEAILGRFDLDVIERYFPEYPQQIGDYL
jgi:hypothetical protein